MYNPHKLYPKFMIHVQQDYKHVGVSIIIQKRKHEFETPKLSCRRILNTKLIV